MNMTMGAFRAITKCVEDDALIGATGKYITVERKLSDSYMVLLRIYLQVERVDVYGGDFILRVVGAA